MRHATAALFSPDHPAADDIDAAYEALYTLRRELEDQAAADIAARAHSAVAGLATTVAAVHINAEAEPMGQLAREVTDIART
jgi:phosphate uptake regulator